MMEFPEFSEQSRKSRHIEPRGGLDLRLIQGRLELGHLCPATCIRENLQMADKVLRRSMTELLEIHELFSTTTPLDFSFGDGFRFHHEPLYRHIRQAGEHFNLQFTTEDSVSKYIFADVSLKGILDLNEMPVRKTADFIRALTGARKKDYYVQEVLNSPVQFDYLLHETLHCVTWAILNGGPAPIKLSSSTAAAQYQFAFEMLLLESISVATDYLATAFTCEGGDGSPHHAFQTLTSAHYVDKKMRQNTKRVIETLGFHDTFVYTVIANMYGNYLYEKPNKKMLKAILPFLATNLPNRISVQKVLESELQYAIGGAKNFRTRSANAFFSFCGVDLPIQKLTQVDFIERLMNSQRHLELLRTLTSLFQHGTSTLQQPFNAA